MDPPLIKPAATLTASDYSRSVDHLLLLYSAIDKAALSVPAASAMPLLKFMWNIFKFYFALLGDIFLIVPINIVVFVRNLFPGSWSYKCFCCRYFKAAFGWIWKGECTAPLISVRLIAIAFLHWHFRNRLFQLRRHISVATGFSEDEPKAALAKIDRAMDVWQQRTSVRSVIFAWVLPLLGPATALWNWLLPTDFMPSSIWTRFAVLLSVSYALTILTASFQVKRGLMLGESGPAAQYPGFAQGPGYYAEERKILSGLGLQTTEFPLDVALVLGSLVLGVINYKVQMDLYTQMAVYTLEYQREMALGSAAFSLIAVTALALIALVRRKKLGRV